MFEQRISRAVVALSIVLAAMLVASCGGGIGGPPKEMSDLAIRQLYFYHQEILRGGEIKNVEVMQTSHIELTPALRAKGVEDAWCFTFAFAAKSPRDTWYDSTNYCIVYKVPQGQWEATCSMFETQYCP